MSTSRLWKYNNTYTRVLFGLHKTKCSSTLCVGHQAFFSSDPALKITGQYFHRMDSDTAAVSRVFFSHYNTLRELLFLNRDPIPHISPPTKQCRNTLVNKFCLFFKDPSNVYTLLRLFRSLPRTPVLALKQFIEASLHGHDFWNSNLLFDSPPLHLRRPSYWCSLHAARHTETPRSTC